MNKGNAKTQSLHHQHVVHVLQGAEDARPCVLIRHQMGVGVPKHLGKVKGLCRI